MVVVRVLIQAPNSAKEDREDRRGAPARRRRTSRIVIGIFVLVFFNVAGIRRALRFVPEYRPAVIDFDGPTMLVARQDDTIHNYTYDHKWSPSESSEAHFDPSKEQTLASSPGPGNTVLRLLWKQLKEETPPGQTSQKVLAHWKPREKPNSRDIVLLAHGTLFKLETFLVQLRYWNGPASLALHINEISSSETRSTPDEIATLETFLQEHRETLRNTSIHVMMEYTNSKEGPLPYPHNLLRNLAMAQCDSDYILALDVDFIPHPADCYSKLHTLLFDDEEGRMAEEMRRKKLVMVLPAFEGYDPNPLHASKRTPDQLPASKLTPDQLPASKLELFRLVEAKRAQSFQVKMFPPGHGPTNFTKWFEPVVDEIMMAPTNTMSSTSTTTPSPYYPIFYQPLFEPYVLAYRPGIPSYWNDFRGYGQNKLSWFQELDRAGYLFGSLWDFFVFHLPHPTNLNHGQHMDNDIKFKAFEKYLDEQYPIQDF